MKIELNKTQGEKGCLGTVTGMDVSSNLVDLSIHQKKRKVPIPEFERIF